MATPAGTQHRALFVLQAVVLTVAALYFGRPILMPLAMAVLLVLLLAPVVRALERRGLPRAPSVIVVMIGIVLLFSVIAWTVAVQLVDLAGNFETYKVEVQRKVRAFRPEPGQKSIFSRFQELQKEVEEISGDAAKDAKSKADTGDAPAGSESPAEAIADEMLKETEDEEVEQTPIPVRVEPPLTSPWDVISTGINTAKAPVATFAIVIVLVIFMLIGREDLRNRVVRLAGTRQVSLTTKTFDEMERRISRYLLMNALVNGGFGLAVGIGLALIGLHYAPLWGFLAATLRFIPYAGPIIASAMPVIMAFIQPSGASAALTVSGAVQPPDWSLLAMTIGLFIVLELITNNLVEPLVYGRSAGVSTVALLVAAAFWAWIWGPIGLMLSVPMTVVLAVLGKHVPQLESLGILLGDEPALDDHVILYQRLLAGDQDEAATILEAHSREVSEETLFDNVVIPALALAERDGHAGHLSEREESLIWSAAAEMLDELPPPEEPEKPTDESPFARLRILAVTADDEAGHLPLLMLERVLGAVNYDLTIISRRQLVSEVLDLITANEPSVVLLSALGPGGLSQMRYLTKRIRMQFPDIKIIVARWGMQGDMEKTIRGFRKRGADVVVRRLSEAREALSRMRPALAQADNQAALPDAGSEKN